MTERKFVHLHVHTDYSLLEACTQIKPLALELQKLQMPACAITDYGNMYGVVSFYSEMKTHGIKPIIGYEAYLTFSKIDKKGASIEPGEKPFYSLVLLAKDETGYRNLVYLASKAFTDGFYIKPRISLEMLAERKEGLIALSGGQGGYLTHYLSHGNKNKAIQTTALLKDIFGAEHFYLELQDHKTQWEKDIVRETLEIASKTAVPIVATNDVHYLTQQDWKAFEIAKCIGEGTTFNVNRRALETDQYYLKSAEEMWDLFGSIPEALLNTLKIAEMCDLKLPQQLQLPVYPVPEGFTSDTYLENVTWQGFEERKKKLVGKTLKHSLEEYEQRLRKELEIIKSMGFSSYFLIVWDFVKYAKDKGIPVGPGRGSAAGSLVAYVLGITDVDPLQYDLLFERFLNPERISMPDIDIDFCVRGREDLINYVARKYGKDHVCQIITFGSMASRAVIRDVGRALDIPLSQVEKISKLIPPPFRGRNIKIEEALQRVPELKQAVETDTKTAELIDIAKRLEGSARHASTHAAGIVISPVALHEIIPITTSPGKTGTKELVSQYAMTDLERVGMLKMDFLALTTLTIISDCLRLIKEKKGIVIDWEKVPLDDPETMQIFSEGKTEAVFQFESEGMKEICRRLKPKNIEDLAALNALYRPGPLDGGMVDDFIERHHGKKKVSYILPEMKEILANTHGIIVYQEQIMMLAQKLAGYTLGEADTMRRAMGKKKKEEMRMHEEKFITRAVERGIPKEKASQIFHLMQQFADYGFNKSHSVAYAYLAFQTAYLKAHFPAYFYAAVLSNETQDASKIYKYSVELKQTGLQLLPPDINESDGNFTPLENAVRFGLNAIKGLGEGRVKAILAARNSAGRFKSLIDLLLRVKDLNRRAIESLISAGALDSLQPEVEPRKKRAMLYACLDEAVGFAQKKKPENQNLLFANDTSIQEFTLPDVEQWSLERLAKEEKQALGFYLSTNPLENYSQEIKKLNLPEIASLYDIKTPKSVTVAGIVTSSQIKYSKKGNRFCIFKIEDKSASIRCTAWSDTLSTYRDCFQEDEIIVVTGRLEPNEVGGEPTIIVEKAENLKSCVLSRAQLLFVALESDQVEKSFLEKLSALFKQSLNRSDAPKNTRACPVVVRVRFGEQKIFADFDIPFFVRPSTDLEKKLKEMNCSFEWK
jgi:DNA polymerase III subunit alpha